MTERPPGNGDDRDRELLIEAAASAWRPDAMRTVPVHPAWYDLDAEGRARAFEVARTARRVEAALDPGGLSTAARAVLTRIRSGT